MATLSIRVKFKSASEAKHQGKHNDRIESPGYVDASKSDQNNALATRPEVGISDRLCNITKHQMTIKQISDEIDEQTKNFSKSKRKRQKNTAPFIDGVLTFSSDADLTNKTELDKCALNAMNAIIKKHSLLDDALIDLTRHEDESRTHYHFMLKNQSKDFLSVRRAFNRDACSTLQDIAGDAFKSLGIERGIEKEVRIMRGDDESAYINRSVRQLHADLPQEIAVLEKVIEQSKLQLEEATKIYHTPPFKPTKVEIVKKRRSIGHDETVIGNVYNAKKIDSFLRNQYSIVKMLEYSNKEATQALKELETARHEATRVKGVVVSLKAELRASQAKSDDLARVLHDKGLTKDDLVSEIEKSKGLGADNNLNSTSDR